MDQRIEDFMAGWRASNRGFNGSSHCDISDSDLVRELNGPFKEHLIANAKAKQASEKPGKEKRK